MQDNARCKIIKVNLEDQIRTIHDSKSDRKSGYKLSRLAYKVKHEKIMVANRILKRQLNGKMM